MVVNILIMSIGLIVLFFYVKEKIRSYSMKEVFLKTLLSLMFIMVGLFSVYYVAKKSSFQLNHLFIIMGLVFGLLGDVWLDLKYVCSEQNDAFTYAGFISFSLGHVLFMSGMILKYGNRVHVLFVIVPFLVGIIASFINIKIEKIMQLTYGKMKLIVFVYGMLLFSFVALSLSLAIAYRFKDVALIILLIGSILFTLSDLVLSGTYFGSNKERPIDFILNYILYYPAQFLIALSLFFMK